LARPYSPSSTSPDIVSAGSRRAKTTGALSEGADADVALFESVNGQQRCVLTIRGGAVVWDRDGLATTDWLKAGAYSNFK
jgi:hypothetical protein